MALTIYTNNELTEKIKTIFNKDDLKIFEFNYNLFQNFKENEFNIDFDTSSKYIGFTRKDNVKTVLKNISLKI